MINKEGGENMINYKKILSGGLVLGSMLLMAAPVLAIDNVVIGGPTDLCPTLGGVTIPGCGGNPVSLPGIIQFIVNILLFLSFIIALIFLILGGIKWILSGGDKEATGKAKGTVTSALIGLAVVLAAWVLLNILVQVLTGRGIGTLEVPTLRGSGTTTTTTTPFCSPANRQAGNC